MTYVKWAVVAFSLIATVLSIVYGALSWGGQGIILLVAAGLPATLGLIGKGMKRGFPRSFAAVSAVAFLVAAMKTSGEDTDLQNIMVAAFFGLVLAIVLIVKPEPPPG